MPFDNGACMCVCVCVCVCAYIFLYLAEGEWDFDLHQTLPVTVLSFTISGAFLTQFSNTGLQADFSMYWMCPQLLIYFHHQVAAGMKAELRLELYAIAVGVEGESGVGTISHDLQIVTETDILRVPVQANILACKHLTAFQIVDCTAPVFAPAVFVFKYVDHRLRYS